MGLIMSALSAVVDHAAAYEVPACLQICDLPQAQFFDCCTRETETTGARCLSQRCFNYLQCRAALQATRDADIDAECIPTSQSGGCKILLACVRSHQAEYRRQLKRCVASKDAAADTFASSSCGESCDVHGKRARRDVERVCVGCTSVVVPTVTTVPQATTTSTSTTVNPSSTTHTTRPHGDNGGDVDEVPQDRCYQECLSRLDRLQKCYEKCRDTCQRNQQATKICRRGCRNASCGSLKSHCSDTDNEPEIRDPDSDPDKYRLCCRNSDAGCHTRDEAPCAFIPTTSTSTSTSTTRVASTSNTTTTTLGTIALIR